MHLQDINQFLKLERIFIIILQFNMENRSNHHSAYTIGFECTRVTLKFISGLKISQKRIFLKKQHVAKKKYLMDLRLVNLIYFYCK
jgi:hypothetical protein